jgi:hypothetical protein
MYSVCKLTSGQALMSIFGDTILIYQVWLAINHKNQSLQISLSPSCAVIFNYLTDPTIALIFSHNNLHFVMHVRFSGHTFGPILMYKVFNGIAHLSVHILSLSVSTWLLIILVTLTLGWFISILTLEGFQYHFH